ncbi:MAG: hypothetical protein M0006_06040 [Magnetospirillum sp.]|nr:hypothetical protein [Magnetospirillum sp.]
MDVRPVMLWPTSIIRTLGSALWLVALYAGQLYVAVGALGVSEITNGLGSQAVYIFRAVDEGYAVRRSEQAQAAKDEEELSRLGKDIEGASGALRGMGVAKGLPLEKIQPVIDNYDLAPRLSALLGQPVDEKDEQEWATRMARVMALQTEQKRTQADMERNIALLRGGWAAYVATAGDGSHALNAAEIERAAGTVATLRRFGYNGLFTLPREILTLVLALSMGSLGSTLHITKTLLEADSPENPSYYIIRPFQGMLTALVMFVLLKAGQATITSSGGGLNNFFVAFAGIVSGLMSFEAYHMIERAGARLIASDEDEPRWAFNLGDALAETAIDVGTLASGIGASRAEMTAWVSEKQPVPPLQQRLIASWLHRSPRTLFTSQPPETAGTVAEVLDARDIGAAAH